jgi:3-methyladenine DNA glycosylase AlkD
VLTKLAEAIEAETRALAPCNTPNLRSLRRQYSRALKTSSPDCILGLAGALCERGIHPWFAYELIRNHEAAFMRLDEAALEEWGHGINSWHTVDAFARILAGPAWVAGRVSDRLILKWARSKDRWWRRAALVSTVALNAPGDGGTGDVLRTMRICRLLADDQDDMVAKANSWALRQLVLHDAEAVQAFLRQHDKTLPARVKREVKNKLKTGLKNPRKRVHTISNSVNRSR